MMMMLLVDGILLLLQLLLKWIDRLITTTTTTTTAASANGATLVIIKKSFKFIYQTPSSRTLSLTKFRDKVIRVRGVRFECRVLCGLIMLFRRWWL
jgi:hypothetical protein